MTFVATPESTDIAFRFHRAVLTASISRERVCQRLGCNGHMLDQYRFGYAPLPYDKLSKISSTLEISLHWLLTGDGPMGLPTYSDCPTLSTQLPASGGGRATLSEAIVPASDTFDFPAAALSGARPYRIRKWLADALGVICIFVAAWGSLIIGWAAS